MKEYQDVFKRYEKKYLLDGGTFRELFARLQDHMEPDRYGNTTVCNIYYDTPDHRLIRTSLEKPVYKEKLRLRSYGVPQKDAAVFVELKKKYKGVVYKRRIGMPLQEAERFLTGGESALRKTQIEKEIGWVLGYYPRLAPAMFLSYDRIASICTENPNLRITFDSRILWREDALDLSAGAWGRQLLQPGQRIMEIKIPGSMPLWLARLLDEYRVYPASYSKYGNAYLASLEEKQEKGAVFCA